MYWKGWLCAGDHGLSNALGSMVSSRKVTEGGSCACGGVRCA